LLIKGRASVWREKGESGKFPRAPVMKNVKNLQRRTPNSNARICRKLWEFAEYSEMF
jgi:hypothetical protein